MNCGIGTILVVPGVITVWMQGLTMSVLLCTQKSPGKRGTLFMGEHYRGIDLSMFEKRKGKCAKKNVLSSIKKFQSRFLLHRVRTVKLKYLFLVFDTFAIHAMQMTTVWFKVSSDNWKGKIHGQNNTCVRWSTLLYSLSLNYLPYYIMTWYGIA